MVANNVGEDIMGMTFTTLNLYGAERSTVMLILLPSDQLRDQNAPWLTVVPSHDTENGNLKRLEKVAKKLTKASDAAALLFFYFDDDMFSCTLFQRGKKSASFENSQSWAKLGKVLGERFGDDTIPKAFRLASKCSSMEEQIKLLEETVGTAFYEPQEDEPRAVVRSDATLRTIKAREAMLKKRPNLFNLTELALEDWPKELQYRQKLYYALRPEWRRYNLGFFLYQTEMNRYRVSGTDMIFYPYISEGDTRQSKMLLMNGKTGENRTFDSFPGSIDRVVWVTKNRGIVMHLNRYLQTLQEIREGLPEKRFGLLCIDKDGNEQWQYQPKLDRHQSPQFVHTSKQGVITLFAGGYNGTEKADSVVYCVDGETGKLLYTRTFPYQENVHQMIYVDAMNAFLLCRRTTKELILLDETLKETQTIGGFTGSYHFTEHQLCGSILWEGDIWNQRYVSFYDLQSGKFRKTPLEVPAYVLSVLEDGRILGVNEKQNALTVFDAEGIVIARGKVSGTLCRVISENGNILLIEVRGPDTHGYVYDALFDQTSLHVWRLDAVGIMDRQSNSFARQRNVNGSSDSETKQENTDVANMSAHNS